MNKYTTLFFDLFNTLISVARVPEHIGRFTADILGIDRENWNRACFSSAHDITRKTRHQHIIKALAHSIDPSIGDELIAEATLHRQRRFDYALMHVDGDILGALMDLKKRGHKLCLVSNASTAEVSVWPESELASLFDQSVFSCRCGFKKPDASIYRHAQALSDTHPEQGLFIGDGGSNELVGAHNSGMTTVLTTQFSRQHRVEKVRQKQGHSIMYEVAHLRELLDRQPGMLDV